MSRIPCCVCRGCVWRRGLASSALCDLTVFTVEDQDTCLIRRLRRDIIERKRTVESVLTQYETFVKPGYNELRSSVVD